MFTGIIEGIGTVRSIERGANSAKLNVLTKSVCFETRVGDSVAVNGICLTVTRFFHGGFTADIMEETLTRTSLASLRGGSRVNLERALTLSSRVGGHLVSGHIDGAGIVRSIRKRDIARVYQIEFKSAFLRYIIEKGSVALDGISLTVCAVSDTGFDISVIPHTAANTILWDKKPGEAINIECDQIAKYLEKEKLVDNAPKRPPSGRITELFLSRNGFMEDYNEHH